MMQKAAIQTSIGTVYIELPPCDSIIMAGVSWGQIDAFPSPAYWAYQVLAKRVLRETIDPKIGSTLVEEVGACLLGGHGIPAKVGLAAFKHLKARGAFVGNDLTADAIFGWLQEPLMVEGRAMRYRFARQKSQYLSHALERLKNIEPFNEGKALRNWLLDLPGIGYKTASWIARNWLSSDDIAILDIHLLRVGRAIGLFPDGLTVERHYVKLEELFINFSRRIGIRPSELDAVIWNEMMSSPSTVRRMGNSLVITHLRNVESTRAEKRQPNAA